MQPPFATVDDSDEDEEELHPAVAFAMEQEKEEAGAFVLPKNPAPINTAEPEYDEEELHPAVATAEAQAQGEPPPLVNGPTIEAPDDDGSEETAAPQISP